MIIPNDAREELMALGFGLSVRQYRNKIWSGRTKKQGPTMRPRSLSWPQTCRTKAGYVLGGAASNVTSIKQRRQP